MTERHTLEFAIDAKKAIAGSKQVVSGLDKIRIAVEKLNAAQKAAAKVPAPRISSAAPGGGRMISAPRSPAIPRTSTGTVDATKLLRDQEAQLFRNIAAQNRAERSAALLTKQLNNMGGSKASIASVTTAIDGLNRGFAAGVNSGHDRNRIMSQFAQATQSARMEAARADGVVGRAAKSFLGFQLSAGKAGGKLGTFASAMSNVSLAAGTLRGGLIGLAGIMGGSAFVRSADTWTNFENKIGLTAKSTNELASAQAELFRIARESRSSLEAVSGLYTRLRLAGKDLGTTLSLTQVISQSASLGATAQGAANAVTQLSQTLGGGDGAILRAEELNSIIEGSPNLLNRMASGLNLTTGEFIKLARAGGISAKQIQDSLTGQADAIAKSFESQKVTVSSALVVFDNAFAKISGDTNGINGALSTLILEGADGMVKLSDGIKGLGGSFDIAKVFSTNFASGTLTDINNIIAAFKGLNTYVKDMFGLGKSAVPPDQMATYLGNSKAISDSYYQSFANDYLSRLKAEFEAQTGGSSLGPRSTPTPGPNGESFSISPSGGGAPGPNNLNAPTDAWKGFNSGLDESAKKLTDLKTTVVTDLSNGIAEMALSGKANFSAMVEDWNKKLIALAISSAFQAVLNMLSGGMGGAGGGMGGMIGSTIMSFFNHDGGRVGDYNPHTRHLPASLFMGAPKFHDGLTSKEFPTVLERGERVLTEAQDARNIATMTGLSSVALTAQRAAIAAPSPNVEMPVTIINNSDSQVSTKKSDDGMGNIRLEVLVEKAVNKGIKEGRFDGANRGRYGMRPSSGIR
ncbi:tape measure domain-containing protein [Rhodoligotrophos appendicifer]|uniref:tape measure protein n=1 Tax=Rhodoligotrophos appendicifer TaxID=987056 RepID=UPI001187036A|nr:tape measure protein [Rhodoligotrophos appendicifer]